ncbi:MAG: anaerobic ribonucleoside-triphosphate reductase activating protein [Ruminococcaceae bacterium]|nr:anaerobic ribonucleoside-triphosphate reductase activating protein [Oscillospiraceae bacterium]
MHIEAYQKLTLLDFPGRTAATIFTHGCNFRCPFCHNAGLVVRPSESTIDEKELFDYLEKRKKLLDGVCITGGEPLLQKDIADFIRKIKSIGYLVKLDTNGSMPEKLEELIKEGIIDYVAMDIKNSLDKYAITAGATQDIVVKVQKSVETLLNADIDYEFRTTVTGNLHTVEDMRSIGEWIKGAKAYYLQPFKDSGDIVAGAEKALEFECSASHAEALLEAVKPFLPNTVIRG